MKKKKIEKEQSHFFRDYSQVIKASVVLIILIGLLVGVILFKPVKKEEIKDPSILPTNEKNINNNDAKCDGAKATKLKEDAAKITIAYDVIDNYLLGYMAETDTDVNGNGVIDEEPVVEDYGYALKLRLNGLSDDLYVTITNDLDKTAKVLHTRDADDKRVITWYETEYIFMRTYTIKVYSNNDECTNELYREFNVTLPKYNSLSRSADCKVEPGKSMELCQPFIFSNKPYREELREFRQQISENVKKAKNIKDGKDENGEQKKPMDKVIDFVKDNYIIAVIVGVAIVLLVIVLVVSKKKGNK